MFSELTSSQLIGCSGVAWIYAQLDGVCLPWVYVHSALWEKLWVVVV